MEGSTKIKRTKPFKGKSIIENYVFFILLDIICLFYFKNEDIKIMATYTLIRMDIMVFSMLLIILKILKRYFMEFKSFISLVFFDDLDEIDDIEVFDEIEDISIGEKFYNLISRGSKVFTLMIETALFGCLFLSASDRFLKMALFINCFQMIGCLFALTTVYYLFRYYMYKKNKI